jgi:hypothetical protein
MTGTERKKEYQKRYREKNKEKIAANIKEYYKGHKEQIIAKQKVRYQEYKKRCPEKEILRAARSNAKARGLDFNLTEEDVHVPAMCPILNIPLIIMEGKRTDNSPSIDRINNNFGYIRGNIMIISWRANRIKGAATADELMAIARYCQSYGYY